MRRPVAVGEHPQTGKRLGDAPISSTKRSQGGARRRVGRRGPDVGQPLVSGPGQAPKDDRAEPALAVTAPGRVKPEGLALRGGD